MVPHWVLALGTVLHGVGSDTDQSLSFKFPELPADELLVVRIQGLELPSPVDGITQPGHNLTVLTAEIFHDVVGISEPAQFLIRYFMYVFINIESPGVLSFYTLGYANYGRPGYVPSHWEKDIIALHPLESGVNIRYGIGSSMTHVHGPTGVGIGHG